MGGSVIRYDLIDILFMFYTILCRYTNFDNFWRTFCEVPALWQLEAPEENAITIENDQGCTPTALVSGVETLEPSSHPYHSGETVQDVMTGPERV